MYKLVKFLIRHLSLAIENVWHVRWFTWKLNFKVKWSVSSSHMPLATLHRLPFEWTFPRFVQHAYKTWWLWWRFLWVGPSWPVILGACHRRARTAEMKIYGHQAFMNANEDLRDYWSLKMSDSGLFDSHLHHLLASIKKVTKHSLLLQKEIWIQHWSYLRTLKGSYDRALQTAFIWYGIQLSNGAVVQHTIKESVSAPDMEDKSMKDENRRYQPAGRSSWTDWKSGNMATSGDRVPQDRALVLLEMPRTEINLNT